MRTMLETPNDVRSGYSRHQGAISVNRLEGQEHPGMVLILLIVVGEKV